MMRFFDKVKKAFGSKREDVESQNSDENIVNDEKADGTDFHRVAQRQEIELSPNHNILFVCASNMSISPIAEAIFNQFSGDRQAFSAGLNAQSGNRVSQDAIKVCQKHGIELSDYVTANINDFFLDDIGLILTSTAHIRDALKMKFPDAQIFTIKEYAGGYLDLDISDPFTEGLASHVECFMEINEAVIKIIRKDMGVEAEEVVERPAAIVDESIPEAEVLSDGKLIVVSGIDGNLDYYNQYLSLWDKNDPDCHIVFLGNLIYSTEDDDGSLEILDDAIEKSQNYSNFHYLLGINELSCIMGENVYKIGINLKTKFENLIISKKGSLEPYLSEYADFFKKLPYFAKTENGLFLSYSGPLGTVKSVEDIGSDLNLLHDFLWIRKGEYERGDVEEFLDALGLKFMVVGNMLCDDGHEVFSRQLIISSGDCGENGSYLDIDLGEDIDSMDNLVRCVKSVDGIVKVDEGSVSVGGEDVESQNSEENIVYSEIIDKPGPIESLNDNEEIQSEDSQETPVSEELIDKPTLNEKIRNFKYFDDLIHSGVKEIVLDFDIVLTDGEESQYLEGIRLDADDLIIEGNGHTIDAQGKTRIFDCIGKNITIKNIILKNGFTEDDGGAIHNNGSLTIKGSTLIENTARVGGAISNSEGELTITESTLTENTSNLGGAIYNHSGGELTMAKSMLTDNTAQKGDGGAITNGGELTIIESTFTGNTAQGTETYNRGGGVIYNWGSLKITKSALTENMAQRDGGAISNNEGELMITESTLTENTASRGGAIYNYGGELTITNSTLNENTAQYSGGAIYSSGSSLLTITNSTFNENRANFGGAIDSSGCSLTITDSTFTQNTAKVDGGAICNIAGELTITNSTLSENTVHEGDGGAIRNEDGGRLTITNSTLTENTARDGGAISNNDEGSLNIDGCKILTNKSPNNIIFNESFMEVHNTKFNNNQSESVLVNEYREFNISIIDCEFIGNNVEKDVIFNNGKSCTIQNTIFENNLSRNITNKTDLTLISSKIKDDGQSIWNDGHILIRQSSNLESKIYGDGTVETDSIPEEAFDFGYLDKKIHESKSKEIILNQDITFENYEIDYYEGGIELDIDDLVIDGNGHTIDGANKSRIFIITGKNITLKNITFKNGVTHDNYHYHFNISGGAIRINHDAKITIENCEFIINTAQGEGGAIYNWHGELTITESTLSENTAKERGGAIHNGGELTINESKLDNNSSEKYDGGAIYNGGSLTITGSILTENTAGCDGGAINNNEGSLTITGSILTGNTASWDGGAINNNGGKLTVTESSLSGNTAKGINMSNHGGGAIYNWQGELIITKSSLKENTTQRDGGAIYNNNGELIIIGSILTGNTAERGGGAIYDWSRLTITDSVLENNAAENGGAIDNGGELTITGSILTGNTAKRDGGAIDNGGELTITDSVLENNAAENGGAIDNGGELTITDSTLNNNTAQEDGGAIYNGDKLTITDSLLENNTASKGGAIYSGNEINMANCTLIDNSQSSFSFVENDNNNYDVKWNDDVISSDDVTIYLDNKCDGAYHIVDNMLEWNKTLSNGPHEIILELNDNNRIIMNFTYSSDIITTNVSNYAELINSINKAKYTITPQFIINLNNGDYNATDTIIWRPFSNLNLIINGNGIMLNGQSTCQFIRIWPGTRLTLNNIKLTDYTATSGGAIHNLGELTIIDSTLTENTAQVGGAIQNGGELTITDSTLTGNSAESGGAISNIDGELMITDSTLTGNSAESGGAIDNNGGELTIAESTLQENIARYIGGAICNWSRLTITDSVLENNTAETGGAIRNGGVLTITDSTLNNNAAQGNGGAIKNYVGELTVTESILSGNTAESGGGAIYNWSRLTINDSILGNNTASKGGAIYLKKSYESENCTFKDNKPDDVYEDK